MNVVRSVGAVKRDESSVVTVGTFDGVHLAHQEIIREVVTRARLKEGRSVVVTFEPHPKEVVGRRPVHLLTTLEERVERIGSLQVDLLLVLDFTYEFSRTDAQGFYRRYVVEGIGVGEVVVGYDHLFGRDRSGGIDELVHMGKEFNFSVSAIHPYRVGDDVVSSTKIRTALASGDVVGAAQLLGYPYSLRGEVEQGDGRGRILGYPTANLRPDSPKKVVPGRGVYFVGVVLRGRQWYGMLNVGRRPTVGVTEEQTVEVHIFGLEEEIYGERLEVCFLRKLREEQKFASLQELREQLGRDRETSLRLVAEFEKQH